MSEDAQRRSDEQLAAQTAMYAVTMVEAVRRGLAPRNLLRRIATIELYERLATIPANGSGIPPRPCAVRVQVVHDRLAHAAVVIPAHGDERAASYVLELGRGGTGYPWLCQELTRVEQFRLLKLDEHTHPTPRDLDKVLRTAHAVHARAAEQLRAAEHRLQQLQERARGDGRSDRAALRARAKLDDACRECERLRLRVTDLEQEILNLQQTGRVAPLPDRHRALLGPIPKGQQPRQAWRALTAETDRFRLRWAISDPSPLPDPPADAPAAQRAEHQALCDRIEQFRHQHQLPVPAEAKREHPGQERDVAAPDPARELD